MKVLSAMTYFVLARLLVHSNSILVLLAVLLLYLAILSVDQMVLLVHSSIAISAVVMAMDFVLKQLDFVMVLVQNIASVLLLIRLRNPLVVDWVGVVAMQRNVGLIHFVGELLRFRNNSIVLDVVVMTTNLAEIRFSVLSIRSSMVVLVMLYFVPENLEFVLVLFVMSEVRIHHLNRFVVEKVVAAVAVIRLLVSSIFAFDLIRDD